MKKKFQVSSDLSKVQGVGGEVLDLLKPLRLDKAVIFDIRLCLEEALINAMKHGSGLDKSKFVTLDVEYDNEKVEIAVEDQGRGFDPEKLKDCTHEDNLYRETGRGVHLIQKLMDKVQYNAKGNRVLMVKYLGRPMHGHKIVRE